MTKITSKQSMHYAIIALQCQSFFYVFLGGFEKNAFDWSPHPTCFRLVKTSEPPPSTWGGNHGIINFFALQNEIRNIIARSFKSD